MHFGDLNNSISLSNNVENRDKLIEANRLSIQHLDLRDKSKYMPPKTKHCQVAFVSLQHDKSIIIKPVNKDGATVVMREMYLKEIDIQLSDTTTYQRVPINPMRRKTERITSVLQKYLGERVTDSQTAQFLIK